MDGGQEAQPIDIAIPVENGSLNTDTKKKKKKGKSSKKGIVILPCSCSPPVITANEAEERLQGTIPNGVNGTSCSSKKTNVSLECANSQSKCSKCHGFIDVQSKLEACAVQKAATPPQCNGTHSELQTVDDTMQPLMFNDPPVADLRLIAELASGMEKLTVDTVALVPPKELPTPPTEPEIIIDYREYVNELQMPDIMRLIQKDLSEPYSIYTYRYFIHNWPKLCFLAMNGTTCVGAIVCKLDLHRQVSRRGYIAMLAVDKEYRKLKIGTTLVQKAIEAMLRCNADEVVLETEITNIPALRLYENLGFVRDKRLFGYYLNGVDALRLKLWFR